MCYFNQAKRNYSPVDFAVDGKSINNISEPGPGITRQPQLKSQPANCRARPAAGAGRAVLPGVDVPARRHAARAITFPPDCGNAGRALWPWRGVDSPSWIGTNTGDGGQGRRPARPSPPQTGAGPPPTEVASAHAGTDRGGLRGGRMLLLRHWRGPVARGGLRISATCHLLITLFSHKYIFY